MLALMLRDFMKSGINVEESHSHSLLSAYHFAAILVGLTDLKIMVEVSNTRYNSFKV